MARKGKRRREAARGRRQAEPPEAEAVAGAAAPAQRQERVMSVRQRPSRERRRKGTSFPVLPVAGGALALVIAIAAVGYLLFAGGSSSSAGDSEQDPFAGKTADVKVEITAIGESEDSRYEPTSATVKAGQTVEIVVKNIAQRASHNLHLAGADKEYDTLDDCLTCGKNRLVSFPQAVGPGKSGHVIWKAEQPGTYAFRCDFHPQYEFGTLLVQ